MGNCHAVDPVCATVEHPSGKVDKIYFSSSARQLMLRYPGHYVALLPPPPTSPADGSTPHMKRKLKLLPPDSMLNIGSCYRLVSFEEMSETGALAHQTSRKRSPHSSTTVRKHRRSLCDPVQTLMEQSDVSRSPTNHINKLRGILSMTFASQKENGAAGLILPAAPDSPTYSFTQSPPQPLHSVHRGGAWRPSLQSIAERGR